MRVVRYASGLGLAGALAGCALGAAWYADGHPGPELVVAEPLAQRIAEAKGGEERRGRDPDLLARGEEDEAEGEERRERWFEQRHRHPPDVDWRAVERANATAAEVTRSAALRAGRRAAVGQWAERGSDNVAGSSYFAALSLDGTKLYAGSDRGGLWRGTLEGEDWAPLADNLFGGVHQFAILPPETAGGPDVLLVANNGGSVRRSVDDGLTWDAPAGLPGAIGIRKLVPTQDGTGTIYVVLQAGWYEPGSLYKSTDWGKSFTLVRAMSRLGDVWVPRVPVPAPSPVFLLDTSLEVSLDGGASWNAGAPLPDGTAELAGSEAGGPRFYAIVHAGWTGGGLWRTDDLGQTWHEGPQATDYYTGPNQLQASIVDPDLVAYGGVDDYRSVDGGQTFARINSWADYYGHEENKLHADIMAMSVVPGADGETWYIGNHGGVYRSTDGLQTVHNLTLHGLRVSQYYSTQTSSANPSHVIAGAQDQGWQATQDAPWDTDDVFDFGQTWSGDYGQLVSGNGTHDYVFGVYPGFIAASIGEKPSVLWAMDYPSDPMVIPPWLPFLAPDREDPASFFFLGSKIYHYEYKSGSAWKAKLWSEKDFDKDGGEYLSAMAFSPIDGDLTFAITSSGRMFRSVDRGVAWDGLPDDGPIGNYYYGAAIAASKVDVDVAWVGGSGYYTAPVFRTTDGGDTWSPWSEGLPQTLVYCLCESPDGAGTLYAGTETGAWRRGADDPEWVDITGTEAPITTYWSCESLTAEDTIRFGTYGRGIWDYREAALGDGCYPDKDEDGDGVGCDTDCDDSDLNAYPGAPEACDGVDSDCDGAPEVDIDGDGVFDCEDCNDASADVFPGATETCGDGVDQDCDGQDAPCAGDDQVGSDGCGCDAAGPGGAAAAVLLALALATRRRR